MIKPPTFIKQFAVVEYGFLPEPVLPKGYIAPADGSARLQPMQNFALCVSAGVEGYYLFCCTPDWHDLTYCFEEQASQAKEQVFVEFGRHVQLWHRLDG